MRRIFNKWILLILFLVTWQITFADDINFSGKNILIGKNVSVYEDKSNLLDYNNVLQKTFTKNITETPNFGISKSTYWLKFVIKNMTDEDHLLLQIEYPMLESATIYCVDGQDSSQTIYENSLFRSRLVDHQDIIFKINIKPGTNKTYLIKVKGNEQIVLPLILSSQQGFLEASLTKEIITGIHIGILLVMILYNLFVYFSIRDRSYLYYVLYILFIGLTQISITGYSFKYLWPGAPYFNHLAIILFPSLAGSFAMLFLRHFLQTRQKTHNLDQFINFFIMAYGVAVLARLFHFDRVSYRMIDFIGLSGSIFGLIVASRLSIQNFRPAKFFLVAWTIFLFGIILFVLRNLNILPYNIYTNYTMQAGTAIEVMLLSFALADKINILTAEKEYSQQQALNISLENQQIIKQQNIVLEEKVTERTTELTSTNHALENTLTTLKNTQSQLVDAEKMASLGQLTAGIAHEINNPINFVSSNIKPLKRDIDDMWEIVNSYDKIKDTNTIEEVKNILEDIESLKKDLDVDYLKSEVKILLDGMQDGAQRTVEIVKGLKIFSRVDEADLKFANINDGIQSTLVILNNQMGPNVRLVKDLGNLPDIECFAGKLNQVFMNIISNAIFAVQSNSPDIPPVIAVKTSILDKDQVRISIKDNGMGMPPEVKAKIFEPFFTTKDVGKGTGLGLSIVFQIIEMHNGKIEVISKINEGTEFIIDLPINHLHQNT